MPSGLDREEYSRVMKSIEELGEGIKLQELEKWTGTVEKTAKELCNDKTNSIMIRHTQNKELKFTLMDSKSKDCLIKAIEIHHPEMPILLQGVFNKLANDLKDGKISL